MSLWPSNSAQTISFGGYTKLAHKTQVTGFFSYGLWSNDEPLQPFTINSALAPIALPRGNADAEAEHALFERFRKLAQGRTALLVSHRFPTVRMADRIVVLEGGQVVEDGTHQELVAQGGRYGQLFALQAQGYL